MKNASKLAIGNPVAHRALGRAWGAQSKGVINTRRIRRKIERMQNKQKGATNGISKQKL